MSMFGKRFDAAWNKIDLEMGDYITYTPMRAPVNGEPVLDTSRSSLAGTVRGIIVSPGTMLGNTFALAGSMHTRSSEDPYFWYRAHGKLADVRKKDILYVPPNRKTYTDKPRRYEVVDGPMPVGFGVYRTKLFELTLVAGDP